MEGTRAFRWTHPVPVGRVYNEPEVNPDLFVGEILGIERLSLKPGRQILK